MVGADGPRKSFKFELSRFAKTSSKFLDIHDMRDTHYIIFCYLKKQLIIVFRGGNTMKLLTEIIISLGFV